ncbi:MAG: hypothetical protein QGG36_19970 [Pirellulaceae bacterium]|nr:hypothetical protein [Pirellulaceae bacterium]MDP7018092.1 hypothetical protein [Pirellulaceae bacterium]
MSLLLIVAATIGGDDSAAVARSPAEAIQLFLDGTRRTPAGHSGNSTPTKAPTARRVEDAATDLALQLLDAQVSYAIAQRVYSAQHPALANQDRQLKRLKQAVAEMRDRGHPTDRRVVDRELARYAAVTRAALDQAAGDFRAQHPEHKRLKTQLAAIESIQKKRANRPVEAKPKSRASGPAERGLP